MRSDLTEGERGRKFAGHSRGAGLASSTEADERYVQKHLGHASAEMPAATSAAATAFASTSQGGGAVIGGFGTHRGIPSPAPV